MKNVLKSMLLLACLMLTITASNAQSGRAGFEYPSHNFGNNIPEKGGNITHRFIFTNNGNAPVTIQNVTASCGCTSPAWIKEPVAPGQQGFVDATYRPAGRPGSFTKNLTVTTNGDPKMIALTISGVVVKAPQTVEEEFPVALEGVRVSERVFAFGRATQNDNKESKIKVYNSSETPVTLTFSGVPEYLKIQPVTLQPKEKGTITCNYTATKKTKYGTAVDNFDLLVDGKKSPSAILTSNVTVIPTLTNDKNVAQPLLSFQNNNYAFSNIKQGSVVSNEYKFTNTGKGDLEIIALNHSESIKVTYPKKPIKPNESGTIKVELNTKKLKGNQDFSI
jgi:hypothetical protein